MDPESDGSLLGGKEDMASPKVRAEAALEAAALAIASSSPGVIAPEIPMDPALIPDLMVRGTPPPSFPITPLLSSIPSTIENMLVGMGKRADPLAFWSARSMEPSIASHILMCSTRLLCLSMMAMTAETFRFIAFSIASMASALATGSFKSRSPSHEEEVVEASHCLGQAGAVEVPVAGAVVVIGAPVVVAAAVVVGAM